MSQSQIIVCEEKRRSADPHQSKDGTRPPELTHNGRVHSPASEKKPRIAKEGYWQGSEHDMRVLVDISGRKSCDDHP